MSEEKEIELFTPGCLGTCWYGKYHYFEPWAGCGHDCPYCYARFRAPVKASLSRLGTPFEEPRTLYPEEELLRRTAERAASGEISILKLCRYTDIFTPSFVGSGLSLKLLDALTGPASRISRVIITTKGLPDKDIIDLIRSRPAKFSYNAAVRPGTAVSFDRALLPAGERLAAAAAIQAGGVLTTVHMDPFVPGFDDESAALKPFLEGLKKLGLNRVMFSYLLLSGEMAAPLEKELPPAVFAALKDNYDLAESRQYLPRQADTVYWAIRPEVKRASVEKTAAMLNDMGFDFVLCSLKNTPGLDTTKFKGTKLCDGKFYA
jgi:DNA repair photolyase